MRRRILLTCGILSVSLCMSSCGILPAEEEFDLAPVVKEYEGNNYSKYTVTRGDMVQKDSIDASYQGTVKYEVLGEGTATRIKKIRVKKGQKVEVGDVLVENYVADQERVIKDTNRQIESLELQIKQAKELRERELAKLKKIGGSKKQKEAVRVQYDSQIKNCESTLKLARLDLKSAKEEIEANYTTSDLDGTVTKVDTSFNGGYAEPEDVLVVVQGKKRNRFKAKTEYASRLKDGQEVTLTVLGQQYKTVKKTSDKKIVYFYPKTELTFKNGVVGSLELILKVKKNVLYLPAAMVFDMGSKKIVYIEAKNGVRETREVTLGERIDNLVEITGGLKENEQVITN